MSANCSKISRGEKRPMRPVGGEGSQAMEEASEIHLRDGEKFPLEEREGKYVWHQLSSHYLLSICLFITYYVPGFMLGVGIANWTEAGI